MLIKFETKSDRVKGLSFHLSRPWILASLHTGTIQLWDYRTSILLEKFTDHEGPVRGVSFHNQQPLFVSGGDDYKVKVWNYKQKRCMFTLLGHSDYIRTTVFHTEYPWIASASDDQTVRIWNWQSRSCLCVLAGHNHYVMCASFHPTADLLLSAALDQTVRVWDISGLHKTCKEGINLFTSGYGALKFIMEGHTRGVNWACFHPNLTLIASGGDDHQVKLWRYEEDKAFEVCSYIGHYKNVSSVLFHKKEDLLISNGEDRAIKVWDLINKSCVHTFRRERDRFWMLTSHPTLNLFAAGHDTGMLIFKLERERPIFCLQKNSLYYVKDKTIRKFDFNSKDLPIAFISNITWNNPVRNISVDPDETSILISVDAKEGSYYELRELTKSEVNYRRYPAKTAHWIAKNAFVVIEKNHRITIRNSKNQTVASLLGSYDEILGSHSNLLGLRNFDLVTLYDTQKLVTLTKMKMKRCKLMIWSPNHDHVILVNKYQIYICDGFLRKLSTIKERVKIKSGAWDGERVFVYTTSNHIKYALINGESGVIRTLDVPIYITRVRDGRIHCLDRECQIKIFNINTTEYRFKLALINNDYRKVVDVIRNNKLVGESIISYLNINGYTDVALHFVKDKSTSFELALKCGNLKVALKSAYALNDHHIWSRLAHSALQLGRLDVAQISYKQANCVDKLFFLYLITGNLEGLRILGKQLGSSKEYHAALLLGDVEQRAKVLLEAKKHQLSYLTACVHGFEHLAESIFESHGQTLEFFNKPGFDNVDNLSGEVCLDEDKFNLPEEALILTNKQRFDDPAEEFKKNKGNIESSTSRKASVASFALAAHRFIDGDVNNIKESYDVLKFRERSVEILETATHGFLGDEEYTQESTDVLKSQRNINLETYKLLADEQIAEDNLRLNYLSTFVKTFDPIKIQDTYRFDVAAEDTSNFERNSNKSQNRVNDKTTGKAKHLTDSLKSRGNSDEDVETLEHYKHAFLHDEQNTKEIHNLGAFADSNSGSDSDICSDAIYSAVYTEYQRRFGEAAEETFDFEGISDKSHRVVDIISGKSKHGLTEDSLKSRENSGGGVESPNDEDKHYLGAFVVSKFENHLQTEVFDAKSASTLDSNHGLTVGEKNYDDSYRLGGICGKVTTYKSDTRGFPAYETNLLDEIQLPGGDSAEDAKNIKDVRATTRVSQLRQKFENSEEDPKTSEELTTQAFQDSSVKPADRFEAIGGSGVIREDLSADVDVSHNLKGNTNVETSTKDSQKNSGKTADVYVYLKGNTNVETSTKGSQEIPGKTADVYNYLKGNINVETSTKDSQEIPGKTADVYNYLKGNINVETSPNDSLEIPENTLDLEKNIESFQARISRQLHSNIKHAVDVFNSSSRFKSEDVATLETSEGSTSSFETVLKASQNNEGFTNHHLLNFAKDVFNLHDKKTPFMASKLPHGLIKGIDNEQKLGGVVSPENTTRFDLNSRRYTKQDSFDVDEDICKKLIVDASTFEDLGNDTLDTSQSLQENQGFNSLSFEFGKTASLRSATTDDTIFVSLENTGGPKLKIRSEIENKVEDGASISSTNRFIGDEGSFQSTRIILKHPEKFPEECTSGKPFGRIDKEVKTTNAGVDDNSLGCLRSSRGNNATSGVFDDTLEFESKNLNIGGSKNFKGQTFHGIIEDQHSGRKSSMQNVKAEQKPHDTDPLLKKKSIKPKFLRPPPPVQKLSTNWPLLNVNRGSLGTKIDSLLYPRACNESEVLQTKIEINGCNGWDVDDQTLDITRISQETSTICNTEDQTLAITENSKNASIIWNTADQTLDLTKTYQNTLNAEDKIRKLQLTNFQSSKGLVIKAPFFSGSKARLPKPEKPVDLNIPGHHARLGNYETTFRLLHSQAGVVNFEPYRELLQEIFGSFRMIQSLQRNLQLRFIDINPFLSKIMRAKAKQSNNEDIKADISVQDRRLRLENSLRNDRRSHLRILEWRMSPEKIFIARMASEQLLESKRSPENCLEYQASFSQHIENNLESQDSINYDLESTQDLEIEKQNGLGSKAFPQHDLSTGIFSKHCLDSGISSEHRDHRSRGSLENYLKPKSQFSVSSAPKTDSESCLFQHDLKTGMSCNRNLDSDISLESQISLETTLPSELDLKTSILDSVMFSEHRLKSRVSTENHAATNDLKSTISHTHNSDSGISSENCLESQDSSKTQIPSEYSLKHMQHDSDSAISSEDHLGSLVLTEHHTATNEKCFSKNCLESPVSSETKIPSENEFQKQQQGSDSGATSKHRLISRVTTEHHTAKKDLESTIKTENSGKIIFSRCQPEHHRFGSTYLLTVQELITKTQTAYQLTTAGKFEPAIAEFQKIIPQITLLMANKREEMIAADLLKISSEYILGLKMEVHRRSLAREDQKKHCELSAYFTHFNFLTIHKICTLRLALNICFKARNFKSALRFAQRLLELGPSDEIAGPVKKMVFVCQQDCADALDFDYDEAKKFVMCGHTFMPIYEGFPVVRCSLCGCSYFPEFRGFVCNVCTTSEIGFEGKGLNVRFC